ncbi:hypothetical protein JW879_05500 [candidate division WOR-3 bacterium]|nr:hypothetical protein [candidate division WOR-3 bacterium]
MENKINLISLVVVLFFVPFFAEGKSAEGKSFIREIKENITKEKEKVEEKSQEKEQDIVKAEVKEKNKDSYESKDKNKKEEPAENNSRIEKVKDLIAREEKKIETKSKEKKKEPEKIKAKEKDEHNDKYKGGYDYDHDYKNNPRRDYVHDYGRRYYKKTYRDYPYFVYDDLYFYDPPIIVTDVVYDDYTYIDDSDLISRSPIYTYRHPRRIPFLSSTVEAAYLGKDLRDTYGVTAKISANLYNLHFNCFYQNIFSSEEKLTIYSVNGGVSFALANFILTPFVGGFYIEPLEEAQFSYGADLQIFLPGNYNLDLYTINSSYGSLNFNNVSASLNREFYVLNVGLGFNYNNYAGVNFSGPFARLSLGI